VQICSIRVQEEFAAHLKCGHLEHGFLRVHCDDCHVEKLAAFSCKRRRFCPSSGARRMTDSAALLADEVLPRKPLRKSVLSLPFALRFLLATDAEALTQVLGIVNRTISAHVLKKARLILCTMACQRCILRFRVLGCKQFPRCKQPLLIFWAL
jgi:hypothetical protein